MARVAASLLAADFSCLQNELAKVGNADYLHVDIMDGHFVPNLSFGPGIVAAVARISSLPLNVHLMVDEPGPLLPTFMEAGGEQIESITVHAEACRHLHRTLQEIKSGGVRAGVALNPATPLDVIKYVLPLLDLVLIMTVNPGFGGQKFLPETLPKIRELSDWLEREDVACDIAVDGGIDMETSHWAVDAGANILIAGSAIFTAASPSQVITRLRQVGDS